MKPALLFFLLSVISVNVLAGRISGTIRDEKGDILPYASVLVKGTTRGATANQEGKYVLDLAAGEYTLICQYVGYSREVRKVSLAEGELTVDFRLSPLQLSMAEVVVRPGGEDPAYAIIRKAIKKRKDYEAPLDSFTCEAYVKTLIRTRKLPRKILGQKVEDKDKKEMGVDSAGKGIIYLSESLTKVAYKRPGKVKLEVLSGRESGSNGYGFSVPTFINFYNNDVTVLPRELSPRGFISPIAASALNFYKYKYLGSFFEDGREINRIQVIPKRKFEPVFSGTIDIVEGDWRIHSLDLQLVKESMLEILDTLHIRQLHVPVEKGIWQVKDQVIYFSFNIFGIDAVGNFLNVYNKYDIAPAFRKRFFNNVLIRYDTAANKKSDNYWDSIRPVPLEPEEAENYQRKDSVYRNLQDSLRSPSLRDTLLRRQGRVKVLDVLFAGFSRSNFDPDHPVRYSLRPLVSSMHYNTVEGINLNVIGAVEGTINKERHETLGFFPHIRYGFHNTRLNAWGTLRYSRRSQMSPGEEEGMSLTRQTWSLSGGKRVSQFNASNPISEMINDFYTLLARRNYMKIYENYFLELATTRRWDNGLRLMVNTLYEDRIPVNNTTDYSLIKYSDRHFTPNYPYEQLDAQFQRHKALISEVNLQFQPGQRYIEFPDHRASIGSNAPTMALDYRKGWDGVLGSIVNFDKWQFSIWDQANFKLYGSLKYKLDIGGFLNTNSVPIQDYRHFNGDQTIIASEFLNSFQLAPYYANSTTASFYTTGHLEHHFNGLLTNKIPLFRRLKWHLVAGANGFYVNSQNNYAEVFGGLENIFKLFRVDLVNSWLDGRYGQFGVRLGLGGILGGNIKTN